MQFLMLLLYQQYISSPIELQIFYDLAKIFHNYWGVGNLEKEKKLFQTIKKLQS